MEFPFDFSIIQESLGPLGFLATSYFWHWVYFIARNAMIFASIGLFAAIIFILIKSWPLRKQFYISEGLKAYTAPQRKITAGEAQREEVRKKWGDLIKKIEEGGERAHGLVIIEADVLLEDILGRMGYAGGNIAERLRSLAPGELANIEDIWEAHKLRNRVAHEVGFVPTRDETMRALSSYKKALEELNAI